MFRRRARSGFTLSDIHVGQTLTVAEVDFTFTYRRAEDQCDEPCSIWARDQTCLLFFDFGIDEKGQKNLIKAAEVKVNFAESGCPQLNLTRVAPNPNNAQYPSSERTYRSGYTIEPTADTPFGGGGLGSYHRESECEGLPDWRFRGILGADRPCQVVTWRWTRGKRYTDARGVPLMKAGVMAKDHPNTRFMGAVTMRVNDPFWRSATKNFLIEFKAPNESQEDPSALLEKLDLYHSSA